MSRRDIDVEDLSKVLPPCRVCGDKATGFHYGANTCEACKGFFRRSLVRKVELVCPKDDDCPIVPGSKANCPYCRLQKCLQVGMGKERIKKGRYSLEKKMNVIKEVKQLKATAKVLRREQEQHSPPTSTVNDEDSDKYDDLISSLVESFSVATHHLDEIVERMPQLEAEYKEKAKIQEDLYGSPLGIIDREEYIALYLSTGLDVDGRKGKITAHLPKIEEGIKKYVAFAQSIPGFNEINEEDRCKLLKSCESDYWILTRYQQMNVEERLISNSMGECVPMSEMAKMLDEASIGEFHHMAATLQKLELDRAEKTLLISIVLLSTDRCQLKQPSVVEELQAKMSDALRYFVSKSYPNDPNRYGRILLLATRVRTYDYLKKKMLKGAKPMFDIIMKDFFEEYPFLKLVWLEED